MQKKFDNALQMNKVTPPRMNNASHIIMLLQPQYKKHSAYLGKTIYKRIAGTGTSGGAWMVDGVSYLTLAAAKFAIEYYNI